MTSAKTLTLQDLPKEAARLVLEVEKFISQEIGFDAKGKEFVLAFSGGADSKALFYILLALAPRMGFTLSLAHLDHALRETSAEEAKAATLLAESYGLPCYVSRVDVDAVSKSLKLGKEEAGRVARLEFMEHLKRKAAKEGQEAGQETGPKTGMERWILFAHQLNDLAEDVLMRLLRGTGWPALGGMQAIDQPRRHLRPLLLTSREEIENFLESIKADWIRDPMNEDPAYLRNRVRSRIIPLMLEENPSFLKSVADLWRLAGLDNELYAGLLKQVGAKPEPDGLTLPHAPLGALPKALRLRAYKKTLEAVPGPGQPLLSNLLALDRAWAEKRGGVELQFPGNKKARVVRGSIKFNRG